jgi:hypothetical protein
MREITNPQNLESIQGHLLFTPKGETGAIDLGNVILVKQENSSDTRKGYYHSRSGTKKMVREDLKDSTIKFSAELNERTPDNEAIILFGQVGPAFTQAAVAVAATANLVGVKKRRTYSLPKLKVYDVTAVKMPGNVALIVGERTADHNISPANADIIVDKVLGKVYITDSGIIADGSDVDVTYKCQSFSASTITDIGSKVQREGSFQLTGFRDGNTIQKLFSFEGQMFPKDIGGMDIEDFQKFSIDITASKFTEVKIAD